MKESEVKKLIAAHIDRAGGLRALSREWGVSAAQLSDVMTGRRGPGPKIVKHLGLRRVVRVDFVQVA